MRFRHYAARSKAAMFRRTAKKSNWKQVSSCADRPRKSPARNLIETKWQGRLLRSLAALRMTGLAAMGTSRQDAPSGRSKPRPYKTGKQAGKDTLRAQGKPALPIATEFFKLSRG